MNVQRFTGFIPRQHDEHASAGGGAPFTTHTQFFFEHNRPDQDLEVLIQVFTVSGRLVKTIQRDILSSGYRTAPIDWDGLDDFGSRIGRGVYIYRVQVRTVLGETAEKYEKLVILR